MIDTFSEALCYRTRDKFQGNISIEDIETSIRQKTLEILRCIANLTGQWEWMVSDSPQLIKALIPDTSRQYTLSSFFRHSHTLHPLNSVFSQTMSCLHVPSPIILSRKGLRTCRQPRIFAFLESTEESPRSGMNTVDVSSDILWSFETNAALIALLWVSMGFLVTANFQVIARWHGVETEEFLL